MPSPVETIDTKGSYCPYPIVATARAVKALKGGEVLLVLSSDPGVETDMPMWCKATRNEHLGTFREGAEFRTYVRKRR
jgi:TusA-related sulfurtransferase